MYAAYRTLLILLRERADPDVKAWWEGYVKQGAPLLGVKMARVRSALHRWYEACVAGSLDTKQRVELALALFDGEFRERKR
jgi:hypothetical protein